MATHYMGGEITYDHISGETYRFRSTVYRDCSGSSFVSSNLSFQSSISNFTLSLSQQSVTDITPLCPGQQSRCQTANAPYGVEEFVLEAQRTLTTSISGPVTYTISDQFCCRNNAITTLTSPGSQRMYLQTQLVTGQQNSSPRFLNAPVAFLCANVPATISPNGFDPDGDAIVYSLQSCKDLNANDPVSYAPGFSATAPLTTSGGVNINPNTGLLSFTPSVSGQVGVICILAEEFRNGVKIGEISRDIQVRVLGCNNNPPVIDPLPNVVVQSGTQYCVTFNVTDADNNNITVTQTSGIVPAPTLTIISSQPGLVTAQFCWTPGTIHEGQTFTVSINATDDACPSPGAAAETFNITVPIVCRTGIAASATNESCPGVNDGTATAAMTGGTPPYQFDWTGPNNYSATTANISGLGAGQYCVTIVDGNACVNTTCVDVVSAGSPIAIGTVVTDANCGQNNGTITANASGGTAPYSYQLNGGASQANGSFSGLAQGSYTIDVTDNNGCTQSTSATVGQAVDNTPPVINCSGNQTLSNDAGQCGAVATFSATATDDCGQVTVAQTAGPASGSLFPVGSSTVTFTATDGNGNTASCSMTITVNDTEDPTISCPGAVNVTCAADVPAADPSSATAADNCPGVTVAHSGDSDNGGSGCASSPLIINRTYTATDASGNTSSCTQTITVIDNVDPVITCPANVSQVTDAGQCGAIVNFAASATDNCSNANITYSQNPGTFFPTGTTTVSATATDACGNTSSCSFTVTVNDTENPNAVCQNVTVQLDGSGNGSITVAQVDGGSTDNCGIASITIDDSTFDCSDIVAAGNASDLFISEYIEGGSNNKCVEIYNGTGAAVNLAGYSIQIYANGNTNATSTINLSGSVANGDVYVVCNSSATAAFTAQADQTTGSVNFNGDDAVVLRNGSTNIDIFGAIGQDPGSQWTVSGNMTQNRTLVRNANVNSGNTTSTNGFPTLGSEWTEFQQDFSGNLGSHTVASSGPTVTLTVTDLSGNVSTCVANITVEDNINPNAVCQNVTVQLDDNGNASVAAADVDNGSSDNCAIASLSVSPNTFTCANVGNNAVVLTVTDVNGNSSTCSATVNVEDNVDPVALCQSVIVQLDGNGSASITTADIDNGSYDNCAVSGLSLDDTSFDCADLATVSNPTDLMFSEYIEGSGFVKCVEIYNGTGAAVNLSGYSVQVYFNGNTNAGQTIALSGTLAHGDVYVVCNPSADALFLAQADQTAGGAQWNGDDAVALVNGSNNIDIIGSIGQDPGTRWSVSGNETRDQTLVRNSTVGAGNTSNTVGFPALGTEWTGFPQDDHTHLGTHFHNNGANVVTLTVTDVNGNSNSCQATVEVQDNVDPVAVCPAADPVVQLDANGNGSLPVNSAGDGSSTDNCTVVSETHDAFAVTCANVGNNSYTLTATDQSGNTNSTTCNFIVEDNVDPVITCPTDITLECIRDVPVADPSTATASDGCGIASVVHSGDVDNGGTGCAGDPLVITRTYTATDVNGNSASCAQTITVESTPIVTVTSPNAIVFPAYADSACTDISVAASGGCPGYTYLWSNGATSSSQNVCPTVTTVYTVTVTDAEGCFAVDSVQVCVIDLVCVGGTNNGQNGNGQGGQGSTNGNGQVHIYVCHIPPGNPNNAMTKCLPVPAVASHLSQGHGGDHLGPCGSIATRDCSFGSTSKQAAGAADLVIQIDEGLHIHTFPNPTHGKVKVEVEGQDGTYRMQVVDLLGQVVLENEIELKDGMAMYDVNLSTYAAGFFYIIVDNGSERAVAKVMKD